MILRFRLVWVILSALLRRKLGGLDENIVSFLKAMNQHSDRPLKPMIIERLVAAEQDC